MTESLRKPCYECGEIFEPMGLEGVLNAYCGACEKDLPDGVGGYDEHGIPHVWSSANEQWIPIRVFCDKCGDFTNDDERITAENWEYCAGLQRQFCGSCREAREEPPCDDPTCEADVCYDKREEQAD